VNPFIVRHGHYSTVTGAGLEEGKGCGTFRGQQLSLPLATVCATNDKHVVCPIITKHYTGVTGHALDRPLGTVTAIDHHALTTATLSDADREGAERVSAFMIKYYSSGGQSQSILDPLHTVTSKARFGLVTVHGSPIVDIATRMLIPRELFRAQAFADSYIIDPLHNGKPLTITAQTRLAGNSVSPVMATALVLAQMSSGSAVAA
jgi:DNA (cytosine-5)-methyltransferase 1